MKMVYSALLIAAQYIASESNWARLLAPVVILVDVDILATWLMLLQQVHHTKTIISHKSTADSIMYKT